MNYSYSDHAYKEYRAEREARQAAEQQAQQAAERENARLREQRLTKIEADRLVKQRQAEAALEAELVPERRRLLGEWLIANPGRTESDFDKLAWPHYKEWLAGHDARVAREMAALRASGRYSSL